MKAVPCIPTSAPFTTEQRAWLNGYLAGLFTDGNSIDAAADADSSKAAKSTPPLLVMYGSQTGTAEGLAKRLAIEARQRGFDPRVLDMNAYTAVDLVKERRLLIVTSTWGDGDPPDNAAAFWQHLCSETAPQLNHLAYSVLALGDRNYSDFCGAGKKFDAKLEQLGAKRLQPRTDCDTDYEAAAKEWMDGLWPTLQNEQLDPQTSNSKPQTSNLEPQGSNLKQYDRKNPFPARLITNRRLNSPDSAKDTRHFEISLEGSGLAYEAGDALGVMPSNCPALVEEILHALGCDGEEAVATPQGQETALRNALLRFYVITQPTPSFLQAIAAHDDSGELKRLLEPAGKSDLQKFLHGREVIDFLLTVPAAKFAPPDFVKLLRTLQPRLYSISSSPKAHPGEVHLTVSVVCYETLSRRRKGVCSTFLAERADGNPVPVFVQTSHGFRLPNDGNTPAIMIGPGTGIAPFRAFLEERRCLGAPGKNWLFFGDQHRDRDFLYREEIEPMLAGGTLARLDLAFSRDQSEKIYVQHRMLENAQELWRWLEDGAHVYVCGDAKRMAKDVDATLHKVIEIAGGRTAEQAAEYVRQLKTGKRYQRDVY